MSQAIFDDIDPTVESGTDLATLLNDFKDALASGFSGASRPPNLQAKGMWIDTSADPIWTFKLYTGSVDISVFTINTTLSSSSVPGATDTFAITHISADTVSPILDLIKKRIASLGQVLGGDYVGTIQMRGYDNAGTLQTVGRVRAIATQNFTSSLLGTDLIFEATSSGSAAISEMMRLKNGQLGIGTTAPSDTLHAVGTGIRSEKNSDDAVGAQINLRKQRIAGTKAVQSSDVIGQINFNSTDQLSAEQLAAKIVNTATENHTSTAQGSKLESSIKKVGTNTFVVMTDITDLGLGVKKGMNFTQTVDSSTTGAAQSITPATLYVKLTNASLTSINNIVATNTKFLVLINGTGAILTVTNNSGGTAANRIKTGTVSDLTVSNGASLFLVYDDDASRWQVVGGSGSGGGLNVTATQTVSSLGTITTDQNNRQLRYVQGPSLGDSANVTTPMGSGGWIDGTELILMGRSDADYLELTMADVSYGILMDGFTTYTLTKNKGIRLLWDNTNLRWLGSPY